MKTASTTLINFLNGIRGKTDAMSYQTDAYVFTLLNGSSLYYTKADVSFTWNGDRYLANSILISGLKFKQAIGLQTDQQQIKISATSANTIIGGAPFLQALRNHAFDGAQLSRYRVWFSTPLGGGITAPTVVDGVLLFKGRIGVIQEIGRTTAKITVNSDLALLDIDMPTNQYQPTCLHTLYDVGCTLSKASFRTNGTVGAGSMASLINWSGASINFVQGTLAFTSGVNAGVMTNVSSVVAGTSLSLAYPLQAVPNTGDGFQVEFGCDHTPGTCGSKFNNLINFRGFPLVPPPQMAF